MKRFWLVFLIVAVCMVGAFLILWRLASNLERGGVAVGGVLHWRVEEAYAEERSSSLLGQILHGRPPLMREVIFGLRRAARDRRIRGLLLDVTAAPGDWAQVEELREAVGEFRSSGKPVVCYLEAGGTREYALATAAEQIVLAPEGNLMVLGVSAELAFLKNTLEKLGMKADFVHVGKFKSAPEQLTRSEASAANREMVTAIVENRYQGLVGMIAEGRQTTPEKVRGWIDVGIYDAPTALSAGLVDSILSREDLEQQRFAGEEFTTLEDYLWSAGSRRGAGRVALVYVDGTIVPGESHEDRLQGKMAGSTTVVDRLEQAREDHSIDAVVLRVNSPGGSAMASDLIWNEVQRLRRVKPVVVSMSGYAASGGYYVSCGADSLFAEPGTLTGSIGVFAGKVDMSGFFGKIGVDREYITRGENALFFGNQAAFTPGQRARLQGLLDDFYSRFVDKVAAGRDMSPAAVNEVAQGRVWTGEQALSRHLVDGLGGLLRALDSAKFMMGLKAEERVAVVTYEKKLSLLERVLLRSLGDETRAPALPAAAAELLEPLAEDGVTAAVPLLDGRPLALLPYRIHVR
jgi:protease-4